MGLQKLILWLYSREARETTAIVPLAVEQSVLEGQSNMGILSGDLQKVRVLVCHFMWSYLLSITALLTFELSFYLAYLSLVPELRRIVGAFKW